VDAVKPSRPTPLDVISADDAAEVITATEHRLAALNDERLQAEATADDAERQAVDVSEDLDLHSWASGYLERFKRQVADEHEAELRQLIAAAELRARDLVDRARREADVIISYARAMRAVRDVDSPRRATPAETAAPADATPDDHPARPAADMPASPIAPDTAPLPVTVAPVDVLTTGVSTATSPAAEAPSAPTPLVVPPAPPLARDPTPSPPSDADAFAPLPGPSQPATAAAGPADRPVADPDEFWPEEPKSGLRRFMNKLPGLAMLQVGAVLVILTVVLLRVG
jgi:hypothetical protein